jgi:transcriptional regulator GlxA family with amidase domain
MITPAPITPGAPLRVSILVFDEVEVLDCCGPFEVFSVANRVLARRGLPAGFEVCLVATTPEVTARGGLVLRTHATLDAVPPADVLLVAGGVTDVVERDPAVLAHVAGSPAAIIASVCTGAFVLAAAGVVTTQTVTTHAEDVDDLAVRWPALRVVRGHLRRDRPEPAPRRRPRRDGPRAGHRRPDGVPLGPGAVGSSIREPAQGPVERSLSLSNDP